MSTADTKRWSQSMFVLVKSTVSKAPLSASQKLEQEPPNGNIRQETRQRDRRAAREIRVKYLTVG